MKQKATTSDNKSVKIAVLFCFAVFILVFIGFSIKVVGMLRVSSYDAKHRFTLQVDESSQKSTIISFDPATSSLTKVSFKSKTLLPPASTILGVPIDVRVEQATASFDRSVSDGLRKILFTGKKTDSPLTMIDLTRLLLFSRGVSSENITTVEISMPVEEDQVDKKLFDLFTDSTITDENKTISVINATETGGIGHRVERAVSTMGGTVISVSNARATEAHSKLLYTGEPSYTAEKLGKVFHLPLQPNEQKGIADIEIIIGEDSINSVMF